MENSLLPVALLRDLVMGQLFFTSYPGLCGPEEKRSGLRPKRDAFCHSSPNRTVHA